MATIIFIYVAIGIILISVGPFSKDLSNEVKFTQTDNSKTFKIRKALFSLTLILFGILLYPLFYYSYFFQNGKKISNIKPKDYEAGKLYLDKIEGIGNIICKDCDHTETITGFIHGFDSRSKKRTGEIGYQCRDCGKLYSIDSYQGDKPIKLNCDCGGKLQREEPLFCPKCKSTNVLYHLKYMT